MDRRGTQLPKPGHQQQGVNRSTGPLPNVDNTRLQARRKIIEQTSQTFALGVPTAKKTIREDPNWLGGLGVPDKKAATGLKAQPQRPVSAATGVKAQPQRPVSAATGVTAQPQRPVSAATGVSSSKSAPANTSRTQHGNLKVKSVPVQPAKESTTSSSQRPKQQQSSEQKRPVTTESNVKKMLILQPANSSKTSSNDKEFDKSSRTADVNTKSSGQEYKKNSDKTNKVSSNDLSRKSSTEVKKSNHNSSSHSSSSSKEHRRHSGGKRSEKTRTEHSSKHRGDKKDSRRHSSDKSQDKSLDKRRHSSGRKENRSKSRDADQAPNSAPTRPEKHSSSKDRDRTRKSSTDGQRTSHQSRDAEQKKSASTVTSSATVKSDTVDNSSKKVQNTKDVGRSVVPEREAVSVVPGREAVPKVNPTYKRFVPASRQKTQSEVTQADNNNSSKTPASTTQENTAEKQTEGAAHGYLPVSGALLSVLGPSRSASRPVASRPVKKSNPGKSASVSEASTSSDTAPPACRTSSPRTVSLDNQAPRSKQNAPYSRPRSKSTDNSTIDFRAELQNLRNSQGLGELSSVPEERPSNNKTITEQITNPSKPSHPEPIRMSRDDTRNLSDGTNKCMDKQQEMEERPPPAIPAATLDVRMNTRAPVEDPRPSTTTLNTRAAVAPGENYLQERASLSADVPPVSLIYDNGTHNPPDIVTGTTRAQLNNSQHGSQFHQDRDFVRRCNQRLEFYHTRIMKTGLSILSVFITKLEHADLKRNGSLKLTEELCDAKNEPAFTHALNFIMKTILWYLNNADVSIHARVGYAAEYLISGNNPGDLETHIQAQTKVNIDRDLEIRPDIARFMIHDGVVLWLYMNVLVDPLRSQSDNQQRTMVQHGLNLHLMWLKTMRHLSSTDPVLAPPKLTPGFAVDDLFIQALMLYSSPAATEETYRTLLNQAEKAEWKSGIYGDQKIVKMLRLSVPSLAVKFGLARSKNDVLSADTRMGPATATSLHPGLQSAHRMVDGVNDKSVPAGIGIQSRPEQPMTQQRLAQEQSVPSTTNVHTPSVGNMQENTRNPPPPHTPSQNLPAAPGTVTLPNAEYANLLSQRVQTAYLQQQLQEERSRMREFMSLLTNMSQFAQVNKESMLTLQGFPENELAAEHPEITLQVNGVSSDTSACTLQGAIPNQYQQMALGANNNVRISPTIPPGTDVGLVTAPAACYQHPNNAAQRPQRQQPEATISVAPGNNLSSESNTFSSPPQVSPPRSHPDYQTSLPGYNAETTKTQPSVTASAPIPIVIVPNSDNNNGQLSAFPNHAFPNTKEIKQFKYKTDTAGSEDNKTGPPSEGPCMKVNRKRPSSDESPVPKKQAIIVIDGDDDDVMNLLIKKDTTERKTSNEESFIDLTVDSPTPPDPAPEQEENTLPKYVILEESMDTTSDTESEEKILASVPGGTGKAQQAPDPAGTATPAQPVYEDISDAEDGQASRRVESSMQDPTPGTSPSGEPRPDSDVSHAPSSTAPAAAALSITDLSTEELWEALGQRRGDINICECGFVTKDPTLFVLHRGTHAPGSMTCRDCNDTHETWEQFLSHSYYSHLNEQYVMRASSNLQ